MSRQIKRDGNGHFAAGASGNPDGARRRKPKELLTVDDFDRIILEVASEVVATRNGKPVTLFHHNARSLATGKTANRLASRDFMQIATSAAARLERARLKKEEEEKRRLAQSERRW